MAQSFVQDQAQAVRLAMLICIALIYLLYHIALFPHCFWQNEITHRFKAFANDITHRYIYGVFLLTLSLFVFPHIAAVILAYLFLATMIITFVGKIFDSPIASLVGHIANGLATAGFAIGLLGYHWEWMYGRD